MVARSSHDIFARIDRETGTWLGSLSHDIGSNDWLLDIAVARDGRLIGVGGSGADGGRGVYLWEVPAAQWQPAGQ